MPLPKDCDSSLLDFGGNLCGEAAIVFEDCPRGVQLFLGVVGVVGCGNLAAPASESVLVGELVGVVCRKGDGEAGDSARRNGEFRDGGEPYPNGDGLYDAETDYCDDK